MAENTNEAVEQSNFGGTSLDDLHMLFGKIIPPSEANKVPNDGSFRAKKFPIRNQDTRAPRKAPTIYATT